MTMLLADQVAVVTGAGDIGSVVAATLRDHGAKVTVWDRSPEALTQVTSLHPDIKVDVVDVVDETAAATGAQRIIDEMDQIDILVNTAAVATFAPLAEMTRADWQTTIDVNLTGVFSCCQAVVPHLTARGSGSIVNISSIGGLRGEPEFSHYCASKFGVIGLSESLAREVGPSGVRVNCVCPGAVESTMNTDTMARDARRLDTTVDDIQKRIEDKTALRRLVQPVDVANAVVFLSSNLASSITGVAIPVTGGIF